MARVVTLATLPQPAGVPGVARGSITGGETQWLEADLLSLAPGASVTDPVPAGSDAYFFVTKGGATISTGDAAVPLPLQATAVVEEGASVTLANASDGETLVLLVLAPPAGVASSLTGFSGGLSVAPRATLPMVEIPDQKKKRYYIVSKEAAKSQRGHAMIVGYEKDTVTVLHHHPDADSMFVLLEGSIQFVVDGKPVVVGPGEATVFRAGDRHSLRCADGVTEAAFLEFHIPAAFTTVKE